MAGQRREHGAVLGAAMVRWLLETKKKKKNERERERKVGIYKRRGLDYYNLAIPK